MQSITKVMNYVLQTPLYKHLNEQEQAVCNASLNYTLGQKYITEESYISHAGNDRKLYILGLKCLSSLNDKDSSKNNLLRFLNSNTTNNNKIGHCPQYTYNKKYVPHFLYSMNFQGITRYHDINRYEPNAVYMPQFLYLQQKLYSYYDTKGTGYSDDDFFNTAIYNCIALQIKCREKIDNHYKNKVLNYPKKLEWYFN